jgi:lipopolysaccharide transport system ATP-binding protein
MSETAISVENLSKLYLLGQAERQHESLLGELTGLLTAPFRNFRDLRRLDTSRAGADGQAESPDLLWALKDVSFEVKRGEVLGVIGRNGAGKSTLLKVLSRITEPTRGRVRIRGRVASLLEVGTGFHPELTGRENVYLNGTILGMTRKEIDQQFDAIVDFSGIERFLSTPVKRYSSGMKVRLGFAVAAHLLPDILIVDEVLAVGDQDFQRKCIGKMQEIASGKGRTILFVSHNMGPIASLCHRVIWMHRGQVHRQGPTDEVIGEYMSSFVERASIPLDERTDRGGSGEARLRQFRLLNAAGEPVDSLLSGSACRFSFEYESRRPLRAPQLVFSLYNRSGQMLMNFRSTFSRELADELPPRGVLMCHVDRLPLTQGIYRLNAGLADRSGLLDHLEGVATFAVDPGDYFETGRAQEYVSETCLTPQDWRFSEAFRGQTPASLSV